MFRRNNISASFGYSVGDSLNISLIDDINERIDSGTSFTFVDSIPEPCSLGEKKDSFVDNRIEEDTNADEYAGSDLFEDDDGSVFFYRKDNCGSVEKNFVLLPLPPLPRSPLNSNEAVKECIDKIVQLPPKEWQRSNAAEENEGCEGIDEMEVKTKVFDPKPVNLDELVLPPNKIVMYEFVDPSFSPPPPTELSKFFIRAKRNHLGTYVEEFPLDLSGLPYKYEIKVLTTVSKANFGVSNKSVVCHIENLKSMRCNDYLYEYKFDVSFSCGRGLLKDRKFTFTILNEGKNVVGESKLIELRSKRSNREQEFWQKLTPNIVNRRQRLKRNRSRSRDLGDASERTKRRKIV